MRKLLFVILCLSFVATGMSSAQKKEPDATPPSSFTDVKYQNKSLGDWLKVLKDKDAKEKEREVAAQAVASLGSKAKDASPVLFELMKPGQDKTGRLLAAYVLGHLKLDPKEVVPVLLQGIKDEDAGVRRSSAQSLANVGLSAKSEVVKPVLELLKESNADVRRLAIYVVASVNPEPKDVGPALTQAQKDDDEVVRVEAALLLKKLRLPAETMVVVTDLRPAKVKLGSRDFAVAEIKVVGEPTQQYALLFIIHTRDIPKEKKKLNLALLEPGPPNKMVPDGKSDNGRVTGVTFFDKSIPTEVTISFPEKWEPHGNITVRAQLYQKIEGKWQPVTRIFERVVKVD